MTSPVIIDSGPSLRGWSYYAAFRRCRMLFFWKYVYARAAGLGFNDYTEPLARGTMFHVARAHHDAQQWARENGRDPTRILGPIEAVRVAADRIGDIARGKVSTVASMWEAYRRRYPIESFRIVAVEELVEITFGSALYTARLDRVVREPTGKIYVHDTKTTARLEAKTLRKYTLHGQFFGHTYLGRKHYGDAFGGVIVDIVSEDGKCERPSIPVAPFMLMSFPALIERAHDQIEETKRRCGVDPNAWAAEASPDEQTCFGPYGACSCLELCRWGNGGGR